MGFSLISKPPMLSELLPRVREHERQIATRLSKDERATLIALLTKVGAG